MCTPGCLCGGRRSVSESWFLPSTLFVCLFKAKGLRFTEKYRRILCQELPSFYIVSLASAALRPLQPSFPAVLLSCLPSPPLCSGITDSPCCLQHFMWGRGSDPGPHACEASIFTHQAIPQPHFIFDFCCCSMFAFWVVLCLETFYVWWLFHNLGIHFRGFTEGHNNYTSRSQGFLLDQ